MEIFDIDYAEVAEKLVDEMLKHVKEIEEKNKNKKEKEKEEKVKIMDKLEEITDRLADKSEEFMDDDELCTAENLVKLYNLFKQQEDFLDSLKRKSKF